MISRKDLPEAFADGIDYVTDEHWVAAADIADVGLRVKYQAICDAHEQYQMLIDEFQEELDKISEENE